jgi:alkylhydroperoxidase family enzyme
MILRSAQLHGASYQRHVHVRMAREAGVGANEIAALEDWRSSDRFDAPTRCVLAFTEEMVRGRVENETLEELAAHFSPSERIELMATAGFYCMVPRVLDALRLEASDED